MTDTFMGMPVRFDESLEPGEFYLAPPVPDPLFDLALKHQDEAPTYHWGTPINSKVRVNWDKLEANRFRFEDPLAPYVQEAMRRKREKYEEALMSALHTGLKADPVARTPRRDPTDGLKPGRIVTYRSKTGDYSLAAIVTMTFDSTWQPGVAAGDVEPLTGKDHIHLRAFTPGEQGAYQESDVPYDGSDDPEPGTWSWPERS